MPTNPLRVLMTADTVGGVWSYAIELVRALGRQRVEVLLATMGAPLSPAQQRAAAALSHLTVQESRYKLEWMEEPWVGVDASCAWLMELAYEFRPQVVHLNTYAHGALPWTAPVLVVGHSCVLSWWQAVKGEAAPPDWTTYRTRVRAGLARADLVVAPTRAMLDALNSHYGPLRAGRVIYNARRADEFAPERKEDIILTAGRVWDEAKNVAILERVAEQVSWPIHVAGEQQHPEGGRLELPHLHALGHLDPAQMRSWLARAGLYVLPARYEPFGLSVLEAALSGCALVLGDIPSLREVWGNTAVYVPPDDTDMLAAVLRDLICQPHRRHALATAAYARARRYAPTAMAHAYWQAYNLLVARPVTAPVRLTQPNRLPVSTWPPYYRPAAAPGGAAGRG